MSARTLSDFIRALRASDVRVSTGEAIDAAGAMKLVGFDDRTLLRDTLSIVLAKSPEEKETHDHLFDLFFKRESAHSQSTEREEDGSAAPPSDEMDLQGLSESGDEAAIAMALERAAEEVGLGDIRFSTQTSYYAQQMLKAMGGDGLQKNLVEQLQAHTPEGDEAAKALMQARADMLARSREHVERNFDVFGAGATEQFRDDYLSDKALDQVTRQDMKRMRALIARIAKKLATKHSRKRRKRNVGVLDVRRTLRANAGFDGVPFDVAWKQKTKDRPKIMAICDVSGSVSQYVRFLLMLLYAFQEVIPDISSFAFSGRLEDVSHELETHDFEQAMDRIVKTIGMSSTDYGQSWSDLKTQHFNLIDRRTTLIIIGDGRSNYGDGRLDIFREATKRAKRTIWLSPEQKPLWGTGDSLLPRYQPYCDVMTHVSTVRDLERAVDDVLAAYA
ncbi:MAG: VWA domain-containing protein [Hyphomonadaceae bacterium]